MNRVTIEPTEFTDTRTGHKTFGWRAFDDEGQCYENVWADVPKGDIEFLTQVLLTTNNGELWGMIEYCEQNKKGIQVGSNFVSWPNLEKIIKEVGRRVEAIRKHGVRIQLSRRE